MYNLKLSIILALAIFTINCDSATVAKKIVSSDVECKLSQDVLDDIASYADDVKKILDYYISGPFKGQTLQSITDFVDKFGNRLTGSEVLERSIDYIVEESKSHDLENIHTEELPVPHWVRGEESATLIKPRMKNLPMLGLGTSVGTPTEGIEAQVIVVKSFEALKALPDEEVAGKIVLYDEDFVEYGITVEYRREGATEAAKKGAVASLVRSIAPFSIASPHTGSQYYGDENKKIPTAAITMEDADFLMREQEKGNEIVINLKMFPTEDTKTSRNVITELTGREEKDKIVIVSGHIDSWDVGSGAMDDAGGCFISWLAPISLKKLGFRPKRTLRTLFFTAEEQGIIGANVYADRHEANNSNLNFVMESDSGTFAPLGLVYSGSDEGQCMIQEVLKLFESINATKLVVGGPGPDIGVWTNKGIPGGGLLNDNGKYFWFHHTQGDTPNVMDSETMDRNGGFWAAISYVIADMKYDIPR